MKPVRVSGRNTMFTEGMEYMGRSIALNIGLIRGGKRNYIIDTGLGGGSVAPVMEYLGGDSRPAVVINTHSHWDHVWGNWVFKDSLIVAHRLCHETMERVWDEDVRRNARYLDGEARKCLPNLVFGERLRFADDGVDIFYSPGHSADCISVYDSVDRVLYAGDNIGDTDDMIVPEIETDTETFRRVIDLYRSIDFDICVSGHNSPKGKGVLDLMRKGS